MDRYQLLDAVAPCSLLCHTCMSREGGPCQTGAQSVLSLTDGWEEFWGARLSGEERAAWSLEFRHFQDPLRLLSSASCPGCRNDPPTNEAGWGCLAGCVIPSCARGRGIDFCADCADFPCEEAATAFEGHATTASAWLKGTRRLREVGLEAFYDEMRDKSHYIDLKEQAEA